MELDNATVRKLISRDLLDVMIRVGLIAFLVVMCVRIFAPFASLFLWAVILAVALYPLHCGVAARMGGSREGWAATLLVLVILLVIGAPMLMLGSLFAGHIHEGYAAFQSGSVTVEAPDPSVAEWPLIGERLHAAWSAAAADMPAFIEEMQPQVGDITRRLLSIAASTMGQVLLLLAALILAGVMMAYGESGSNATGRILNRLSGEANGPRVHGLVTATIRSVAMGVIGVAVIQAVLLGLGFVLAGIPAAGVLAVVVLLVGIVQLPALIVSLPVIGYLWWAGDNSVTLNVVYTIYLLVAGMSDNVLKPLLLGRGVDAPMPVILIGALGGMVSGGIVGMFIGAVVLAVGYQIFMDWVDHGEAAEAAGAEGTAAQAAPAD